MKIILTGALGFIGSNLLPLLLKDQKIKKILIIIKDKRKLPSSCLTNSRIQILELDLINRHIPPLDNYDCLVHLASIIPTPNDVFNFSDNIKMSENIVNNVILKKRIKRIIYTSTVDVYGIPLYIPIDEGHPTQPLTFYGISKLADELVLSRACQIANIDYAILRLSQVYGPNEQAIKVIPQLIAKVRNNQDIILKDNGNIIRDWLYIKDAANIIRQSIYLNASGIFNISAGIGYPLKDLVDILFGVVKRKTKVKLVDNSNDLRPTIILDITKARKMLKYHPLYDLEKGIKDYINNI